MSLSFICCNLISETKEILEISYAFASQARERAAKEALLKQQEQDDNMTEMANNVYGDFLTENPSVAQSAFGAHRVIPDRWKGMTPEQIADIKRTQELQMKEAQVKFNF